MAKPDHVFFVNAFTDAWHKGNTAAVVILDEYPDPSQMLALASEFGFSETAFLKQLGPARYHIRWFTPEVEVPLCGHATLASAKALLSSGESGRIIFESLSGELAATPKGELIELDFPAEMTQPCEVEAALLRALGPDDPLEALSARASRNLILVYADQRQVMNLKPDFAHLAGFSHLLAGHRRHRALSRRLHLPLFRSPRGHQRGSRHRFRPNLPRPLLVRQDGFKGPPGLPGLRPRRDFRGGTGGRTNPDPRPGFPLAERGDRFLLAAGLKARRR